MKQGPPVLTSIEIREIVNEVVEEGWRDALRSLSTIGRRDHRPPEASSDTAEDDSLPSPADGPPGPDDSPPTDGLSQDSPLSITKRQPNLSVGPGQNPQQQAAGGQKEAPLVMQLQKLGLSQPIAQQLSKTIAQYFKRRTDITVPVAEAIAKIVAPALVEQLIKGLINEARPEYRQRFDQSLQRLKKATARLKRAEREHANSSDSRLTRGELAAAKSEKETAAAGYAAIENDLEALKHSEKGAKAAKALDGQRQSARIRGMADKGIVSKILTRFVADNQQLLAKDEKLQAIFSGEDGGRALNKLRKSIINLLRRQMKRRGYEDSVIKKVVNEAALVVGRLLINEIGRNESIRVLEEARVQKWKRIIGNR